MSRTQNIAQLRAQYALQQVNNAVSKLNAAEANEYRSYIQGLPLLIQTSGFGQAMAFYYSHTHERGGKGQKAYQRIVRDLEQWLLGKGGIYETEQGDKKPGEALMLSITNGSQQDYQLATSETQALLVWFKKFARALIAAPGQNKTKAGGEGDA